MKIPKEYIFAGAAIICVVAAGLFYTSDRSRSSEIYQMAEAAAATIESAPTNEIQELEYEPLTRIKIYIAGAVVNPGVYELDEGSRIEDALRMAGGPAADADMLRINLAARLKDEQQIIVPKEGEIIDKTLIEGQNSNNSDPRININTADEAKLMELPGVGQVTARNIVAYRTEHGDFNTIEEIKNVTRIGEKTFENLRDLITTE